MSRRLRNLLQWVGLVVCLFIALLLLYTGFAKALDFDAFARVLAQHRVVPPGSTSLVAWLVPMAEVGVGVAIVALLALDRRRYMSLAAVLGGAVFASFTAYALVGWAGPVPKPSGCGCGIPTLTDHFWTELIARNAVTTCLLGGIAVLASRTPIRPRFTGTKRLELIEARD